MVFGLMGMAVLDDYRVYRFATKNTMPSPPAAGFRIVFFDEHQAVAS
jgi:hypothetical protein